MNNTHTCEVGFAGRAGSGNAPGVVRWLGLAAAPTFAAMALVSAVHGGHRRSAGANGVGGADRDDLSDAGSPASSKVCAFRL